MDHQHGDSPGRPEDAGTVREVMDRIQAGMDEAERHEDGAALHAALDVILDLLGDEHGDPLTTPPVVAVTQTLRAYPPTGCGSQDVVSHGNC